MGFKVDWRFRESSTKYYKQLSNTGGIVEIKVQIGKNHFRLLGFEHRKKLVILTNGFKKKDQKVPKQEIELAIQRKKDYLEREDRHEWFRKIYTKKKKNR